MLRRVGPLAVVLFIGMLPAWLIANDFDNPLATKIDELRRHFGLRNAIGVVVKSLETGETLYAHNSVRGFIPASGMKLATMGASLHYLGPSYRFETRFLLDGEYHEGVVDGNLVVQGSGDPSLTRHEMDYIARALTAAGLREIRGDVVLDDSFFDDRLRGPASYDDILKKGLPIQSALSYNFNLVELRARASSAGSQADLVDEGYGYFEVQNRVTTVSRGRPWVRVVKLPRDRVLIRGRVIQGDEEEHVGSFVSPDPTAYFASALIGKLRANGILVSGQVVRGAVDEKKLPALYVHRSDRLVEVLSALGKYSNNFSAEQMLKSLGAHRFGAPGSFESGTHAVAEYLVGLGFSKNDFRIDDGSGLSYENHLSAEILARILEDIYLAPELRTDFLCSLAIAGVDGTLRKRFLNEDHMGRIMAKTGSLAGVSSLSGYAFSPTRGALVFSVMTNGIGQQYRADHVEDEIGRALLEY
ncbi:MAG TPA: D-alanyl-D-alanine carboxypeptidase/D-alanyl-D-alanine-endopeptidase [Vicinamibacteria bacterium]|nr:D-alanyl-D-alanine carboxypeptidase/D-alanyl-D-alanine-endopeptidase [Vicinamibacteria bacterium]